MQKIPIYSNPSYQRSLVQPAVVKSEIKEYLDLSIKGTNNRDIKIFPGMEYKFSFYDDTYGIKKIVTGLVDKVYNDQIKLISVDPRKDMVDCNHCHNKNSCDKVKGHILPPMPTCNCILNPPDTSKYNSPKLYFIPLANLMDVSYVLNNQVAEQPKPKGGTKVMILGISATVLKAIVVRLEFFDDNFEEAIKLVELEKDKIYDIAYDCKGTIYETRAKIVSIEECECSNQENSNAVVRENVGMNNRVYNTDCSCHNKDDFMKEPPVRKIKITIDTSEAFDGNLEVITLDSIRDCTLVETTLFGDVDNNTVINKDDLDLLLKYLNKWNVEIKEAADVNQDGTVNSDDYIRLQEILTNLSKNLLGDINSDGKIDEVDYNTLVEHCVDSEIDIEVNKDTADINGDGEINNRDTTALNRYINSFLPSNE